MIKIPLFNSKSLGFDRDMVVFSVKYSSLPEFFAKAIIDTGCPFTIISENVIKRTRISYSSKETKYVVQLGNISLELKELGLCDLNFKDENSNPVKFQQDIYIGIPVIKGFLAQELPSFIGKDFLNNNSLSIINRKEGNNYLLFEN